MKNILIGICLLLVSCSERGNYNKIVVSQFGNFASYKGIDTLKTYFVDSYTTDLDYDNNDDTIVLENLEDFRGDPQTFTIMKVKLGSNNEYIFKNIQGGLIDKNSKLVLPNRIKTDKLYIPETSHNSSFIFIWDHQYPDCSAGLVVYHIDQNGVDVKFNQDFFVSKITDKFKKDNIAIIGTPDCKEEATQDSIYISL